MKYVGMPLGMWVLFSKSFRNNLSIFDIDKKERREINKLAKKQYKAIIRKLPNFEKGDRFKMNIISCAMFISYISNIKDTPPLEDVTIWYSNSMTTKALKLFCRISGKSKFKDKTIKNLEKTTNFKAADRNPYSWNMEFYPYPNNKGYEVRFTKCGICHLLKEYNLFMYASALCQLDYTMSELGETSIFKRDKTIANGDPYCDCGYYKK